jgi:hypothetical protein
VTVAGVTTTVVDVAPGTKLGTPNQWYDPCQFSFPAVNCVTPGSSTSAIINPCPSSLQVPGELVGNVGRNHLSAPGLANVDFTLIKETKLKWHEGMGVEFRAEFFNLFNRPNFDQPSASLFNQTGVRTPGAGTISATVSNAPARQIQMAVRLAF